MSFGPYPEVSLAAARARRDEARAVLRDGADPMAPRRAAMPTLTLKEAGDAYWQGRQDVSDSYRANASARKRSRGSAFVMTASSRRFSSR